MYTPEKTLHIQLSARSVRENIDVSRTCIAYNLCVHNTLTKSRFLDIISRNSGELYQLIILDWDNTRESLIKKRTIDEFLTLKDKVNSLHQASLLLRNLDDVDRFVT